MSGYYNSRPPERQQGAVLAITLLILIVVTVIGVAGMGGSSLQTFLARNNMMKQVSFQRAESSALIGQSTWGAAIDVCKGDPDTCAVSWDQVPAMYPTSPAQWDSTTTPKWDDITGIHATAHGKWVVEFIDFERLPGETDHWLYYYRITSRGQGPNSKAETRLQTVWKTCVDRSVDPPGFC